MKSLIDAPVARLVLDLEERLLLDRTRIVLASAEPGTKSIARPDLRGAAVLHQPRAPITPCGVVTLKSPG